MADVILTLKIMPESPDVDLGAVESSARSEIAKFAGPSDMKAEKEPVAFGLNALKITFVMDENKGSTEDLEKTISELEHVNSVEVVDVRRALG